MLCEVAGRDLVPVLARQARLLGDDADLLEALAAEIDATDARQLAAAPRPLARRAVRRWLRSGDTFPTPSFTRRRPPRWHGSWRSRAGPSGRASSPAAAASNATEGASGWSGGRVADA